MAFDQDTWMRTVFEALRSIDPRALFNVSLAAVDFSGAAEQQSEDFPVADLVDFVNQWLDQLDPDEDVSETEWSGGGVRLLLRAIGRGPSWRGWVGLPSFNLLEPELGDVFLVSGDRRRFIDLSLDEIEQLAAGALHVVGQGASYADTFAAMADEMRRFGCNSVADLPTPAIQVYAGMVGLIPGAPDSGNYDATWRQLHRRPPEG